MVTATSYGPLLERHEGLQLCNEGTPAYDLRIDPISLADGWSVRFDELSRLDEGGFCRSWISRGNTSNTSLDYMWPDLHLKGTPAILPLVIHYKDFGGQWYKSICELHRDVMKKSGFDVKFIRQE